jgi:high-affinity Fe2+/Pb2+ permease
MIAGLVIGLVIGYFIGTHNIGFQFGGHMESGESKVIKYFVIGILIMVAIMAFKKQPDSILKSIHFDLMDFDYHYSQSNDK